MCAWEWVRHGAPYGFGFRLIRMCAAPTMAVFWSKIRWASSRATIPRHSRRSLVRRGGTGSRTSRTSASQSSRSSPREVRGDALGSPGAGAQREPREQQVGRDDVAHRMRQDGRSCPECSTRAPCAFGVVLLARLGTCGPGELGSQTSFRAWTARTDTPTPIPAASQSPNRDGSQSRGQCALLRSAQAARSPRPPSLDSSRLSAWDHCSGSAARRDQTSA
jgi:hypothetical protein